MLNPNCQIPKCQNGQWKIREEITKSVGKRNNWVWERLLEFRKNQAVCQEISHIHGGRQTAFFPPCVITTLKVEAYSEIPPADGWLTENEIAKKRNITWRIARKLLAAYQTLAQLRLDSRNRVRWHYPPAVLQSL